MIPKSIMPSGHLMYISTSILGFRNATSVSHISAIYPYYSWYKVSPIKILVEVSDTTGENGSGNSTPGNFMYPLTTFLDFKPTNPSVSSLLLNTHFAGTVFTTLYLTMILFVVIYAFLDKNIISEIADIFHKFPFGLVIPSFGVSGSPEAV